MRYLLDTNILLRFTIPTASQGELVRAIISQFQKEEQELLVTIQSQAEFWNVATRPLANNGFGLKPATVDYYLQLIDQGFPLVTESLDSYAQWRKLLIDFNVSGVQVHDARLVSVMLANDIKRILTFNNQDFLRYKDVGILPIHPANLSLTTDL